MPARLPIDERELKRLVEVEKWTQRAIAERLGCSVSAIERRCAALRLRTQRTGPRSGELHPDWKGGRVLVGRYWYIYSPEHPYRTKRNYYLEHRLVMERKLRRYLLPHEVVHHKDGNPENNSPENLEVFQTNAEHLKRELTGRIPKWTPQGWEAMQAGVRKSAIRRKSKRGD